MVTGATLRKETIFIGPVRLQLLQTTLFNVLAKFGWTLQAWAIFSNHYHFIAQSPTEGSTLKPVVQRLHSESARRVNEMDKAPSRRVWFQYWDTCLTFEKSYYARLNYVHNNAVKHGLVTAAEQYPYCSAAWFKTHEKPSFYRKVASFRYDRVQILDDF